MKSFKIILCGIAMLLLTISGNLFAQNDNGNEKINDQQKQVLISTAIAQLKENYVFPKRIAQIESVIQKKFDNKEYSSLVTLFDFLEVLNKDFESSGNDHHLNIFYSPEYVKKIKAAVNNTAEKSDKIPAEFVDMVTYENFFLKKVERMDHDLSGNTC
jgi:hypothetical protein